ncbi:MAG: 50S ribosomal protein L11 methyltransferase, partial [Pseudomonadota bacterium]
MLELEIGIDPGAAGELTARIMTAWPGREVEIQDHTVRFRLPVDQSLEVHLTRFEGMLQTMEKSRGLGDLEVNIRNLAGPDWGPEVMVRGRFVIRRPGIKNQAAPDQIAITIDPGQAFGTGGHTSTALVLRAMEEYFDPPPGLPSRHGARVLDLGT